MYYIPNSFRYMISPGSTIKKVRHCVTTWMHQLFIGLPRFHTDHSRNWHGLFAPPRRDPHPIPWESDILSRYRSLTWLLQLSTFLPLGSDNDVDPQCQIRSVPNIVVGNLLDHVSPRCYRRKATLRYWLNHQLGPYDGIHIGTIYCNWISTQLVDMV